MTMILIEGFDDMANNIAWPRCVDSGAGGSARTSNVIGRTGAQSLVFGSAASATYYVVPAAAENATFVVGFGIYLGVQANVDIFSFRSDAIATEHVVIGRDITGAIIAMRGATTIGTSSPVMVPGTWHYLEVKAVLSDTVGEVTVWVDGTQVLNLTGVDTKNGGTKTVFDSVLWAQGTGIYIDDVYLLNAAGTVNNARLGPIAVEALYPNGDGNYSQLLGSDADRINNYQLVDETGTPSGADYVGSAVVGEIDTYSFADLSVASATIPAVQVAMYAQKSDVNPAGLRRVSRRAAADQVGSDIVLSDSWALWYEMLELDPQSAAAWTVANLNATEWGAEVRA